MKVGFKKINSKATVPAYQTEEAAAVDLHACLDKPVVIVPGQVVIIPTGLSIALPKGYEGQVRSRSGLAAKHSVAVLNSPGTVDSDYRGEVGVILMNHGREPYEVKHDDRVAQFVVARVERIEFEEREDLGETVRGDGGFGGTGR